ncbi:MAG: rod shape-determining protein MreC [Candidatus Omnitrophica bacterium]|nr:rod shape-determining protein MreC [Candidatus Omnitrophota bacterium]
MSKLRWFFAYLFLVIACFFFLRFAAQNPFFKTVRLQLASLLERPFTISSDLCLRIKHFFTLPDIIRENKDLHRQNDFLEQRVVELEECAAENERLRTLLEFRDTHTSGTVVARVIGRSSGDFFDLVILDKGSSDGVYENTLILANGALAGRVVEASASLAKALLITNPNIKVSAVIQRTRELGLVQGTGGRRCLMNYLAQEATIEEGDLVLTSGMSEMYPKGLIIGHVIAIQESEGGLFKYAVIEPKAKLNTLEEVICLVSTL